MSPECPGRAPKAGELATDRDNPRSSALHLSRAAGPTVMTPSVKVEKIHPKIDGAQLKAAVGPTCSTTVSSSIKTGLNCPSIPKPPLPSPGQILNEREFDPDIYCGVIDVETRKPCTRSLTCKFCTFGSQQIGRGYYVFDKRWNHIRCALDFMLEKHLNSQMWKKIPPAPSTTASVRAPHRTNSMPASQHGVSAAGFLLPTTVMSSPALVSPSCVSLNNKSVPSHGTTLNANPAALGAVDPVCSMQSRQVSSSPSTPTVLSSVPSPMPSKPQKMKSSKSFKPKESSAGSGTCNSTGSVSSSGGSGKKRKNSSALLAPSHSTESFRKNCVVNSGNSGTSYHPSVTASSHSVGLNCMTSKANSVSLKHDQSGRGPPTGSPAESIKRMSVMMNSSDSTLSLGPFVHQSSELTVNSHSSFSHSHSSLDKLIGKKRKCSPGSSSINSSSSKSNKVAKLTSVNNVHAKHTGAIPGTQGLMNNSLFHQVIANQTDTLNGEDPATRGKMCEAQWKEALKKGIWL
ncbi:ataxin-7-like protein [Pitangus sulphuratus]|nr:ataxin-7-like protein [Pitangus sulphuratus]